MNKVINLASLIVLLIYATLVSIVVYDLSFSNLSLKGLPFKFEIFTSFAVLILLLGIIRILRKWQGLRDMKKYENFIFSTNIAKPAMDYAMLFTILEAVFYFLSLLYFSNLLDLTMDYVLPMILVLGFLGFECLLFLIKIKGGGNSFRIGMDDQVIAYFTREMHLFYYTGLMKVELHQSDLISLTYKEGLNLTLPTNILKKADRIPFRNALIQILENKDVYINDRLRNWE